ncbi:MAG: diguanylate cyclase [Pseudomonadota bacterium]|nr:diguanylate cyclase [Pseudomonadota bacterium]
MSSPLRLLLIGDAAPLGALAVPAGEAPAEIERVATLGEAQARLGADAQCDAVVLDASSVVVSAPDVEAIAARAALIVVLTLPDAEPALAWMRRGADDVLGREELAGTAGWRRLRFAVERRRRGESRRPAYATDPSTGLPHRQQFVEHLSQLLALREREPAPMAVVALRIEPVAGDPTAAEDFELLRRKTAVRLRAAVRASDIVASVGDDSFAVLLGAVLAAADATRVADKLAAGMVVPFPIGGSELSVAVAVGIAHYPGDGNQADRLLRRALALAAVAPPMSNAGPAAEYDAAGALRQAANDER